jgi:hypothetical protein
MKILVKGKQAEQFAKKLLGPGMGHGVATSHPPERSGRHRLRLKDSPTLQERKLKDAPITLSPEAWPEIAARCVNDPIFAADMAFQLRRPRRVDKTRYLLAGHSAARVPMLNASPDSIRNGLNYKEQRSNSLKTAKLGYTSPNWTQRLWQVFSLKYAPGFVIVTDMGMETSPFGSMGELKSAIRKSGWEIVA